MKTQSNLSLIIAAALVAGPGVDWLAAQDDEDLGENLIEVPNAGQLRAGGRIGVIVGGGDAGEGAAALEDGKEHPLKRASKLKREELKHFMTLQIDDLKRACDLKPDQIVRLQVASKGAIEVSIEKWIQEIEDNGWMDMVGQMDPDVADQWLASVGENVSHKAAARHELWIKTIDSVLTEAQKEKRKAVAADRQAFRRKAAVDQAVAILEAELLLSSEQRQRLRVVIDEKLGKKLAKRGKAPGRANQYPAQLPAELIAEILNDAQLARWQDLATQVDDEGSGAIIGWDAFEERQVDNLAIEIE